MVPAPHLSLALIGRTVTLPLVTVCDLDDTPTCRCGERLVLSMPDDSDDTRLIGVCPGGCRPWTVVELAPITVP